MRHRHIDTEGWPPMAIESLFERGKLEDWREFVRCIKADRELAVSAMRIAERHSDAGSAALAKLLVHHIYPDNSSRESSR
jgi:hypothetical protein